MTNLEKEQEINPQIQTTNYSVKIGENLYARLTKVINLLKRLDSTSQTRQILIIEAIKEKLEKESEIGPDDIPRERYLRFKINRYLRELIEKRISLIKKFHTSFSMKQWLLEALNEKLDREERKAKKLLENLLEQQKK